MMSEPNHNTYQKKENAMFIIVNSSNFDVDAFEFACCKVGPYMAAV